MKNGLLTGLFFKKKRLCCHWWCSIFDVILIPQSADTEFPFFIQIIHNNNFLTLGGALCGGYFWANRLSLNLNYSLTHSLTYYQYRKCLCHTNLEAFGMYLVLWTPVVFSIDFLRRTIDLNWRSFFNEVQWYLHDYVWN